MSISESGMLLARVRLRAPAARSFLIAAATSDPAALGVARQLTAAMTASSLKVRWLDALGGTEGPTRSEALQVLESELHDLARTRAAVQSADAFTVIYAGGILDSPTALLLSAAVDGVIMVVHEGKTARADLERVRAEIDSAGGTILGAVMV